MKNKPSPSLVLIRKLILLLAIMESACFPVNDNTNVATISVPVPSPTVASNPTSTATVLPTATSTSTVAPTFTSTQTFLPTSEQRNVETLIPALHAACKLSCWGDMIPGQTSELSAKQFLASLGELGTKSVSFQYHNKPVVIDLTFKDGLVNSINLPPQLTDTYRVSQLLTNYGPPEDIRLEVFPETAAGTSWFNLVLVYPQQGFFAIYSAEGTSKNSLINVCPQDVSPDLYLLTSNSYSIEEMNGFVSTVLQHTLPPLASLTEKDNDQFFEIFREPSSQCLPTNLQKP